MKWVHDLSLKQVHHYIFHLAQSASCVNLFQSLLQLSGSSGGWGSDVLDTGTHMF